MNQDKEYYWIGDEGEVIVFSDGGSLWDTLMKIYNNPPYVNRMYRIYAGMTSEKIHIVSD
jgi:hypothetical protein